MAKKNVEIFGDTEMQKAFKRMSSKYASAADATLAAVALQVCKQARTYTDERVNRKTGNFRKGWRSLAPKTYDNTVVSLVKNTSPHAHLIEEGHVFYRRGRNMGWHVSGYHILSDALDKAKSSFDSGGDELVEKVKKEFYK